LWLLPCFKLLQPSRSSIPADAAIPELNVKTPLARIGNAPNCPKDTKKAANITNGNPSKSRTTVAT